MNKSAIATGSKRNGTRTNGGLTDCFLSLCYVAKDRLGDVYQSNRQRKKMTLETQRTLKNRTKLANTYKVRLRVMGQIFKVNHEGYVTMVWAG